MKTRADILFAVAFMAAAVPASGQRIMSLSDCLRQGVESNFDVKLMRVQRDVADNNVTNAQFMPDLSLNARQEQDIVGSRDHYAGGAGADRTDYTANLLQGDVTLNWRLFDGMQMFSTHKQQRELLQQGELNLKHSMEQLVVNIADQYYYLVTQLNRLAANRRYLEISTIRFVQSLEKYNIGSISGLEMQQAKIDLNADSSAYVLQQTVIENAYVELHRLMGSEFSSGVILSDTIVPNASLELAQLNERARDNNSLIQLARSGQKISDLELQAARAGRYPTLDFNSSYRMNRTSSTALSPAYSSLGGFKWGFTASVKLFNGMETNRKVRNAKLGMEINRITTEQTEQEVRAAILSQYNTYRKNMAMIGFESESAGVALLNLEAAMEMYRLGSMSGLEFREIQRSYIEAEERKFDAIYQAKATEIYLLYLSGDIINILD